jgi:hypothetical protein
MSTTKRLREHSVSLAKNCKVKDLFPEAAQLVATDNTYWDQQGKYQKYNDEVHAKLIPDVGNASTSLGELLRLVTNLYYQLYNNGMNFLKFMEDGLVKGYNLQGKEKVASLFIVMYSLLTNRHSLKLR